MRVREATDADGPALAELLLATPIEAGTAFALDRRPNFFALPRMRGTPRTFVAEEGARLSGMVTVIQREVEHLGALEQLGEIVDVRVAPTARGSRVLFHMLAMARTSLRPVDLAWLVCLIGDANVQARGLVKGQAGLPALQALTGYLSVHYIAQSLSRWLPARRVNVLEARADDGAHVAHIIERSRLGQRLLPSHGGGTIDQPGHRTWLARDTNSGHVLGGMVVWDGTGVREYRVARYSTADAILRAATLVAAATGVGVALPAEGGRLPMWAVRALAVEEGCTHVVKPLVRAVLGTAVKEGVHVLQVNLPRDHPLVPALPLAPRATFHSTLYGRALKESAFPYPTGGATYHADLALL